MSGIFNCIGLKLMKSKEPPKEEKNQCFKILEAAKTIIYSDSTILNIKAHYRNESTLKLILNDYFECMDKPANNNTLDL